MSFSNTRPAPSKQILKLAQQIEDIFLKCKTPENFEKAFFILRNSKNYCHKAVSHALTSATSKALAQKNPELAWALFQNRFDTANVDSTFSQGIPIVQLFLEQEKHEKLPALLSYFSNIKTIDYSYIRTVQDLRHAHSAWNKKNPQKNFKDILEEFKTNDDFVSLLQIKQDKGNGPIIT